MRCNSVSSLEITNCTERTRDHSVNLVPVVTVTSRPELVAPSLCPFSLYQTVLPKSPEHRTLFSASLSNPQQTLSGLMVMVINEVIFVKC